MTNTNDVLSRWCLWQESQSLSDRTIRERAATVRQLLSFTGAQALSLTPEHIIAFTARRDISATSRGTYHASIRAYCKWLVRVDLRADDPSLKTPVPKRPRGVARPVPTSALEGILAKANRRRTRMMILLASVQGLRVHEVAKFHGSDLDRVNGIITVTGKGGVTAILPAHEAVLAEADLFPDDDYWFPSYGEQRGVCPHISRTAVSQAIHNTMIRAGSPGKPHQLRHWYGTELLNAGVDVRIVQELMRHKSLATTQLYTLVRLAQMRAGLARLKLPNAA